MCWSSMARRAGNIPAVAGLLPALGLVVLTANHAALHAQTYEEPTTLPPTAAPPADSVDLDDVTVRPNAPDYFAETYRSALLAPLPARIYRQGGIPPFVMPFEQFNNPAGKLGNASLSGVVNTKRNAFFQSLGTNGRACVTCHQPPSGMSISLRNIKARFRNTDGRDPLFAPVDGANCPDALPPARTSGSLGTGLRGRGRRALREAHSLLLTKGLIRVFLPVPANAQFTVEVLADAPGCNKPPFASDPATGTKILSMYRRPIISANLPFKTAIGGSNPGASPTNIMWDGRESTLASQAIDATFGHAQRSPSQGPLSAEQVQQMVDFETKFFSAQQFDRAARRLDADGAAGGPVRLSQRSATPPPPPPAPGGPPFDEYDAWAGVSGGGAKAAKQRSIARGQALFNTRQFSVTNVAGFNDAIPPGVPVPPGTCSLCHSFPHAGSEAVNFVPPQRDIGTGGQATAFGGPGPASDLPVFRFTCTNGARHPFYGTTVTTNDPGPALITGRCADIGKKTVPQLRALAAHEPYFSDGSARTLADVVEFYDRRFAIKLTRQEKLDLVNFMNAL